MFLRCIALRAALCGFLCCFLCGFLCGCSNPVDRAAKQRIFSPEDPPKPVTAAGEALEAKSLAERPAVARRVLHMSAAEVAERMGPHRYTASVAWEWLLAAADEEPPRRVHLQESVELSVGPGGMSGNFFVKLKNSNNLGIEVLRVGGQVYARSTYGRYGAGQFRHRRRDRGMAEKVRAEAFGALKDYDVLFRRRFQLLPQGTAMHQGRLAWKYAVTLSAAPTATKPPSVLPPLLEAKTGPDATTKRRRHFFALRKPHALQGTLYVDAQKAVVLKAHLDGRLVVPQSQGASVVLHVVLNSSMLDVGQGSVIAAPKDALPDEDKPDGIAAALKRFGLR